MSLKTDQPIGPGLPPGDILLALDGEPLEPPNRHCFAWVIRM